MAKPSAEIDGGAADVVPVREAAYRRHAKIAGTLAFEAATDGVAVYERA